MGLVGLVCSAELAGLAGFMGAFEAWAYQTISAMPFWRRNSLALLK